MTGSRIARLGYGAKVPRGKKQRYRVPSGFTETTKAISIAPATPRGEVLDEAKGLITGDRNKTYGSPTENFSNTAEIWNALLRHKLKDGQRITPTEVATLMVGLKLARTVAQPKRDNFVDMAGYAACGWETLEETGE